MSKKSERHQTAWKTRLERAAEYFTPDSPLVFTAMGLAGECQGSAACAVEVLAAVHKGACVVRDVAESSGYPQHKVLTILKYTWALGLLEVRIQPLPRGWRYVFFPSGHTVPEKFRPFITIEEYNRRVKSS